MRPHHPAHLLLAEDVTATTALRPVVDDLSRALDRKQRASVPDVAGLCALLPPRPPRPSPFPQPGRILARRQRRVERVALQLLLQLLDPLRQRRKLRVLRLQPRRQRQQRVDHGLAPLRINLLRLHPLHTRSFATPPPPPLLRPPQPPPPPPRLPCHRRPDRRAAREPVADVRARSSLAHCEDAQAALRGSGRRVRLYLLDPCTGRDRLRAPNPGHLDRGQAPAFLAPCRLHAVPLSEGEGGRGRPTD